jgi:hypothetical protein
LLPFASGNSEHRQQLAGLAYQHHFLPPHIVASKPQRNLTPEAGSAQAALLPQP